MFNETHHVSWKLKFLKKQKNNNNTDLSQAKSILYFEVYSSRLEYISLLALAMVVVAFKTP